MDKMTKTEARNYLKRCREALRDFDAALKMDDVDALTDAALEASGASAALFDYIDGLS